MISQVERQSRGGRHTDLWHRDVTEEAGWRSGARAGAGHALNMMKLDKLLLLLKYEVNFQ